MSSKTSDTHTLLLNSADKLDLWRKTKCSALSSLNICYPWKNIKKSHKSNKFKISEPIWNEKNNVKSNEKRQSIFQ